MILNKSCLSSLPLLLFLFGEVVYAGDHGLVDDEIWHHVTKVLSDHEGRGKVLLSHPEPAHLVDAYTKVYHHEPHYDNYHHHVYDNHHDGHHHYALNPHHYHHAPPPVPVLKLPVPVPVLSAFRFGPHPPHRHYHHYKK